MLVRVQQYLHAEDKCALITIDDDDFTRVPCVGEFLESPDMSEHQVVKVIHHPWLAKECRKTWPISAEVWLHDLWAPKGKTFDEYFQPSTWEETEFDYNMCECKNGLHLIKFKEIPLPHECKDLEELPE